MMGKKKIAVCLTAALGMLMICAKIPVQAAWNYEMYDQNGDGEFDREDRELMLDAIVNNKEGNCLDVNEDGDISIEDLYVLFLGNNMIGGPSYDTLAGRIEAGMPLRLNKVEKRDTLEVQVEFSRVWFTEGYFDCGVLYDKEKLKVEEIQWSADFQYYYKMGETNWNNLYMKQDRGDVIMLAGCVMSYSLVKEPIDVLATITFSYRNDDKDPGVIDIVKDATRYDDSLENLKDHTRKPPFLLGDMDGDGDISLEDARLMLRAALRIDPFDESQLEYVDVVRDKELTLEDVCRILRIALRVEDKRYSYGIYWDWDKD